MSLQRYRAKRDFGKTSEPRGARSRRLAAGLRFVVQKHAARRLHYDFRLEWDGVLKSWAVPKGPSRDPADKRLAVEVEDHPLEYGDFEGVIPEHQYGAGKVEIWDRGTWTPDGDAGRGLREGHLTFSLSGKRLRGRWALIRLKRSERAQPWLLIKERESPAPSDEAESGPTVTRRARRATKRARTSPIPPQRKPTKRYR